MASREEFLYRIRPSMKLTEDFFKRIYGYEITWPGFAEKALQELGLITGYRKARLQYDRVVSCLNKAHEKEVREVSAWYAKECKKQFEALEKKRGEEQRKQIMKGYKSVIFG